MKIMASESDVSLIERLQVVSLQNSCIIIVCSDVHYHEIAELFESLISVLNFLNIKVVVVTINRKKELYEQLKNYQNCQIIQIASWVAKRLRRLNKRTLQSFYTTMWLVHKRKVFNASMVLVFEDNIMLSILKWFDCYSVVYFFNIPYSIPIKNPEAHFNALISRTEVNFLHKSSIIVVSDNSTKQVLNQTFDLKHKSMKVIYPCAKKCMSSKKFLRKIIPRVNSRSLVFLAYGEFLPAFNFDLLIVAFNKLCVALRNQHPKLSGNVFLIVCGRLDSKCHFKFHYMKYLYSLGRKNIIEKRIYLLSTLTKRKIRLLVRECTIVIFPSRIWSPKAEDIIQAYQMKKIIIAISGPLTYEMINHTINGFLVDPAVNDFYRYMHLLSTNPVKRKAMISATKQLYNNFFSRDHFKKNIVKMLYDNLEVKTEASVTTTEDDTIETQTTVSPVVSSNLTDTESNECIFVLKRLYSQMNIRSPRTPSFMLLDCVGGSEVLEQLPVHRGFPIEKFLKMEESQTIYASSNFDSDNESISEYLPPKVRRSRSLQLKKCHPVVNLKLHSHEI